MEEYDIIIEGDNFTTACFAYYLSESHPQLKIANIFDTNKKTISPFFLPGIVLPIIDLPKELMEKSFIESNSFLEELKSLKSYFEITKNPLLLIYREKSTFESFQKHCEKLAESAIEGAKYTLADIREFYPFLYSDKETYAIEVYDSYSCSDLNQIKDYFMRVAKEKNVRVFPEENVKLDKKNNMIKSKNTCITAKQMTIVTTLINNSRITKNILKVVTAVFEKFPKINLVDFSTNSYLWLEEAGYLNIFSMLESQKIEEEEFLDKIKSNFRDLLAHSEELKIVDTNFSKITTNINTIKALHKAAKENILEISIPIQYELTLAPVIAKRFASKLTKLNEKIKDEITLESLF